MCHMRFAFVVIFCVSAFGQSVAGPVFEAVSVKASDPKYGDQGFPVRGGPGSTDPNLVVYTNISLRTMLYYAYGVAGNQIAGPAWLGSGRFDVSATTAPGTSKEQFAIMFQNMLAERFHLVVHRESKEVQGYDLVTLKGGPKLKPASDEDAIAVGQPQSGAPLSNAHDAKGYPQLDRPGMIYPFLPGSNGHAMHLIARAQNLSNLTRILSGIFGHPIVDKTDLAGLYDFTLEFAMGTVDVADVYAPEIPAALQEQLGLRLEPAKISVGTLVVDSADKVPTEN
jgi:uncharacterized protein (TIGR03435 family)